VATQTLIEPSYVDALGNRRRPSPDAIRAIRQALAGGGRAGAPLVITQGTQRRTGPAEILLEDGSTRAVAAALPASLPVGYHQITIGRRQPQPLIVAPASCYLPEDYRSWGWAIQLYAARSRRSWGIGDLADLRRLGEWAARGGAGIALVNPLAAAAPVLPQQGSPYFPSSRRFRNPLYLRIEEVEGASVLRGLSELASRARALNADRRIDRDAVFRLKIRALERIWTIIRKREIPGFAQYVEAQGTALQEYATYCALAEQHGGSWRSWPARFRHPRTPAVRRVLQDRRSADRVRFHCWLQFEVDRQLARASRALPTMQDLPIGFDPDGADAWSFQDVLADGIAVGAPPDEFNTKGQNWGLPPFDPDRLRAAGYGPFIETIRACLRHAGGLRIDHVMGLFRLFWIPAGMDAGDGAYVRGHARDLLSIVALESQRARAVIVGEDLGTVDERARQQLVERNILSYRLVWFEKGSPRKYPRQALAAVTTHDLPTVAGLWTGSDLRAQKRIGLSPNEAGTQEIHERLRRMTRATPRTSTSSVILRTHEQLALAPSRIVTATLDDAAGVEERPNMPATTDQWPNWSLALPRPLETLERSPLARGIARALRRRR
jgi:4-alpha-glucanotransferase